MPNEVGGKFGNYVYGVEIDRVNALGSGSGRLCSPCGGSAEWNGFQCKALDSTEGKSLVQYGTGNNLICEMDVVSLNWISLNSAVPVSSLIASLA